MSTVGKVFSEFSFLGENLQLCRLAKINSTSPSFNSAITDTIKSDCFAESDINLKKNFKRSQINNVSIYANSLKT